MHAFARLFASNPRRHEGVRPFNVWGLRLFYLLMLVFVAPNAWRVLLGHEGAGEHVVLMARQQSKQQKLLQRQFDLLACARDIDTIEVVATLVAAEATMAQISVACGRMWIPFIVR